MSVLTQGSNIFVLTQTIAFCLRLLFKKLPAYRFRLQGQDVAPCHSGALIQTMGCLSPMWDTSAVEFRFSIHTYYDLMECSRFLKVLTFLNPVSPVVKSEVWVALLMYCPPHWWWMTMECIRKWWQCYGHIEVVSKFKCWRAMDDPTYAFSYFIYITPTFGCVFTSHFQNW